MAAKTVNDIKTFGLAGPTRSGKTTLAEMMLFKSGRNSRAGSPDDGTSLLDYEPEEKDKKCSIQTALADLPWKDKQLTVIDMPGMSDFLGEVISGISAAETVAITVPAQSSVAFQARKIWGLAEKAGRARIIVVNQMDADEANPEQRLSELQEALGRKCLAVNYPVGKGSTFSGVVSTLTPPSDLNADIADTVQERSTELMESIVEEDEALMERYLEGQEVSNEELIKPLISAIVNGSIAPVLFCSAAKGEGVEELMDFISMFTPSLSDYPASTGKNPEKDEEVSREHTEDAPFSAQLVKIVRDDYVGKLSYLKIISGKLKAGETPLLTRTGKTIKFAQMLKLFGAKNDPCEEAIPGEIVALTKVDDLEVSDTLCAAKEIVAYDKIDFPIPMASLAITPKTQADEKKISASIHRLVEEDATFESKFDEVTHELVVTGLSMLHLETILKKLKRKFSVEVTTKVPKIRYMETISKPANNVEYTHKKQSGGAGQYGRVIVNMEPNTRGGGYEFIDKIFGGAIDQVFRPSVDKGIQDRMANGVIAGYPVCDVKVTLIDGKTHPVDSKDIAFQIAGREVFKKAFNMCNPILLEPLANVEITVPSQFFGDISGDISSRRGRVSGMDSAGDLQIIKAEIPLSEMTTYATDLRSMTSGQGDFTMEFSRYDVLPGNLQEKVVAEAKRDKEEESN